MLIPYFKDYKRQVFPVICMVLYVLFTGTDLYTTYLIDPFLERETNPVTQFFQWRWTGHLLYISCMVLMTIFFAVISNKHIFKYFKNKKQNIQTNKFLFIICCLLLIYCYHNLIATFECSINNYLGYRYLQINSESFIQKIAINYVEFYWNFGLTAYTYFITILDTFIATAIAIFQINRVRKYVRSSAITLKDST